MTMEERFERFTRAVSRINRNIQRIKRNEMEHLGLRGTQVMCLYQLGLHPAGLTAAELCGSCGEDRAAVSRTLAQLEKGGYVRCAVPEGQRKYRAPAALTAKGQQAAEALNDCVKRALSQGGDGLTEETRTQFYDALLRIDENLQALCDKQSQNQQTTEEALR